MRRIWIYWAKVIKKKKKKIVPQIPFTTFSSHPHQTEAKSCLRGLLRGQPTQLHFQVASAIMYWEHQFPARLSLSCARHTETPLHLMDPSSSARLPRAPDQRPPTFRTSGTASGLRTTDWRSPSAPHADSASYLDVLKLLWQQHSPSFWSHFRCLPTLSSIPWLLLYPEPSYILPRSPCVLHHAAHHLL